MIIYSVILFKMYPTGIEWGIFHTGWIVPRDAANEIAYLLRRVVEVRFLVVVLPFEVEVLFFEEAEVLAVVDGW